ncbi:MAG: VIT1/CCC1 transporter family protein [bacterium]|nr:VIT1/CCC1 transporter family protein [bacterium]
MSRIDIAKKGFKIKDFELVKKSHTKDAIKESLHSEKHTTNFNLPEIILGGQDGLVNVLGIILGMAAATSSSHIVIIAGLAATFAESISMAAVAYTSKLAEADFYQSEYEREKWEIDHVPEGEREEIRALYSQFGFKGKILEDIVKTITSDKELWVKIMMEQELKLEKVDRKEAIPAAIIVGFSALVGSFIPLIPFMLFHISVATIISLIISTIILFIVGYYKAKKTIGRNYVRMGIEMAVIGMVSALAGYLVGSFFK